jgi:hypothetical protein
MMENEKRARDFTFYQGTRTRLFLSAARLFAFAVVLYVLVLMPCGCSGPQMGETAAEVRRRYVRNDRIRRHQMRADIDAVMLWDTPSQLSEERIP